MAEYNSSASDENAHGCPVSLSADRSTGEGAQFVNVESEHIISSGDDGGILPGGSSRAGAMQRQYVVRTIRYSSDEDVEPTLEVPVPVQGPGYEYYFMPTSESAH